MKKFVAGFSLALILVVGAVQAGEEEDISQAVAAAESWLAIVDAGSFAESWDGAATTFQTGISKAQWLQAVGKVRTPIGAVRSRMLMKGNDAPRVAKLAGGDAVVIQFATAFDKLAPTIETVTPFREPDGSWKVSGYYIRPASNLKP